MRHRPVGKDMVLKSSGGKDCLRTLFPFLALEKNCQNETAQIGTKTAPNGAETAQNFGDHQTCMLVSKMAKYVILGNDTFSAHKASN